MLLEDITYFCTVSVTALFHPCSAVNISYWVEFEVIFLVLNYVGLLCTLCRLTTEAKQTVNNSEKQEPFFSGSIVQTDWGNLSNYLKFPSFQVNL